MFHKHNFSELVFVTDGEAEHLTGNGKYPVRRGDILSLHPGTIHAYDKCDTLKIINVLYDCRTIAMPVLDAVHIPSFRRLFPIKENVSEDVQGAPVVNLPAENFDLILSDVRKLKSALDRKQLGCLFYSLGIFMQILSQLSTCMEKYFPERRSSVQIERAINYITENCDKNIPLEHLLKKAGMSRRNFYRHFRNCTGTSPSEYILQLKLRRAIGLLRDTDNPISEVAGICGFSDGNYMCRVFRSRYGISPGEYRKKLRNDPISSQSIFHNTKIVSKCK